MKRIPTLLLITVVCFFLWSCGGSAPAPGEKPKVEKQAADADLYQCPMHPAITSEGPDNCSICGMALVKVDASRLGSEQTDTDRAALDVNPNLRQTIGVTYGTAEWMRMEPRIRTVGHVHWDERRRESATTKAHGFVEQLHVRAEGEPVKRGQALAAIYSPDISSAAGEYLAAYRTAKDLEQSGSAAAETAKRMLAAARTRLKRLEVGDRAISSMEKSGRVLTRLTVSAPRDGVVLKLLVNEGDQVHAGMPLMVIADPSQLWIMVDAYETDLARVFPGMSAEVQVKGLAEAFTSQIDYIYPELDPKTRTGKLRLSVANQGGKLKPGMYADVTLQGEPVEGVAVSESALLQAGQQTYVFVVDKEGAFNPREVHTGLREAGYVLVHKGLAPGEKVVTSANFLLDSESQIRATIQSLAAGSADSGSADEADPHAGH